MNLSEFWAVYGSDILKGVGVMIVFLIVKYWSFDRPPKFRGGGVLYDSRREEAGPENKWQDTIVGERTDAA